MPVTVEGSNGFTWLGGRDIVCTGNKIDGGRCVVVVANGDRTSDDTGLIKFKLYDQKLGRNILIKSVI